jgi:hypothetical protein
LLPFGPEALELFLRLEKPALPEALPESEEYETIGQFYDAIEAGLRDLSARLGERELFCGDPARQVTTTFRQTGGRLFTVQDLPSALKALDEIVEQGEGTSRGEVWDGDQDVFHPERDEVAHYYRFEELRLGRRYRRGDTPKSGPTGEAISVDPTGIRPMRCNPRLTDHPEGSPIRVAQEEFNRTYCRVLAVLENALDGTPSLLDDAITAMYQLKGQAQALMETPNGDGTMAGPTFEWSP